MRSVLAAIVLWFSATLSATATSSVPVDTGRVVATLLSDHYTVTPGQSFDVALRTKLDDKWHTYWRNPGDSGEPVSVTWTLPDGVEVGPILWPLPQRFDTSGIINYGFDGAPLFVQTITVPESAEPGALLEFNADVYYLVCELLCVPESGQLSLRVEVGNTAEVNARNMAAIADARDAAPVVDETVRGGMVQDGGSLRISFADLPNGDFSDAYFYPYEQDVLGHSDPQAVTLAGDGVVLDTVPGYGWDDGITDTQTGLLAFTRDGERIGRIVTVEPNVSLGLAAAPAATGAASMGLLTAVVFALLGGLILNLMPCVFPVISLKALSLAKAAHGERKTARSEAWAYTAGVFATFALLVAVLLALKAGGAALGWGFQLQNPVVVGLIALLLFAVGLNLIGAFEIAGGSYQNIGSGASMKGGRTGSFFTGALAVLVATPCTAPFMAPAIGYALAQPALATMVVFAALALGFALPFVLLAYAPGLLTKLPKPGPWMVRLREVLSFPMFIAALWLVWVVGNQAGVDGMLLVLGAMLAFAFAVWLLRRESRVWKAVALGVAVASAAIAAVALASLSPDTQVAKADIDPWSPERVAELRGEGRAVFVDFTADWCITCKVTERGALADPRVRQAFADTDTAFLVADWTNKNDQIARELEAYGRAGVPLYLYFPAGDNSVRGEVLPQILTVNMLLDTLQGS